MCALKLVLPVHNKYEEIEDFKAKMDEAVT